MAIFYSGSNVTFKSFLFHLSCLLFKEIKLVLYITPKVYFFKTILCSSSPLFRLIIVTQSYLVRVCFFNSWKSLQILRLLKKLKFRIGRKHLSKLHVTYLLDPLLNSYAWLFCLWYWKVWKRTVLCRLNCYWSSYFCILRIPWYRNCLANVMQQKMITAFNGCAPPY